MFINGVGIVGALHIPSRLCCLVSSLLCKKLCIGTLKHDNVKKQNLLSIELGLVIIL